MEYNIENILEMYEDDYNPSSTVPGPRNMAQGGAAKQLVQPSADGSRPGYNGRGGARPNTGGDRSQYIDYEARIENPGKKFLDIAEKVHGDKPEYKGLKGFELWKKLKDWQRSNIKQKSTTGEAGGVGKLKKNQIGKDDFIKLVNANKDKTYNQFVEIIKDYKTKDNKPFTKNIVADRLRDYGLSGTFKKEPPKGIDPTKKAQTEKKRQEFLKDTDPTGAKGTKKINYHHIRQIAGGVPLTTDDVMLINQRINSQLGGETNKALNRISVSIQKNNRLALEAMNAKEESLALEYMKRSDNLNVQAEKIVNSAIDKLPKKYKGYVGFNQFTLPRDEYGFPISNEPMIIKKVGGMPVSKNAIDLTTLNLKQEKEFKKLVKTQAETGKTGQIKKINNLLKKFEAFGCNKAAGGRILFSNGGEAATVCAKKGVRAFIDDLKSGNYSKATKDILKGGGQFIKGVLNPMDMLKLRNLIGPTAMGFMAAFEGGVITDDVIRQGTPLNESLSNNWLTKSFLPYTKQYAQAKNLLESGTVPSNMKKYVQDVVTFNDALMDIKGIENKKDSRLVDDTGYGMIDGTSMYTKEQEQKDDADLMKKISTITEDVYTPGSAKALEMKSLLDENEATRMAKKEFSPIFGFDKLKDVRTPGYTGFNYIPDEQPVDLRPITYKDAEYEDQRLPLGIEQAYMNKFGLKPRDSLSNYKFKDSDISILQELTDDYNKFQRQKEASKYPGYFGANENFSEGGIASLNVKK